MQVETRSPEEEFGQQVQDVLRFPVLKTALDQLLASHEPHQIITINIDSVRETLAQLADEIITNPIPMTRLFENAIKATLEERSGGHKGVDPSTWRVSFEGNVGRHTITPRGLKAKLVNKLIKLQGIVISASKVRHRLLKSTHFNETRGEFRYYEYRDHLGLRKDHPDNADYRTNVQLYDENNEPLTMEYGFSEYKDLQLVVVQEMPESIPTGLMSRSIEVIVQEDLVDSMKPGDRVQIVGIYQPYPTSNTAANATFRTCVLATSVQLLTSLGEASLTAKEVKSIKTISKRTDLLSLMIRSIAPSICGNDDVKEALLLQLLGGTEKVFDQAMRLRGDINILLVGDPSVGKSQFLRRIMNIASLAFSTTGRGSTGVGLTAAVIFDKDTGEKHLEAGAMVLADRGVICVDEFDKMSIEDRVAMHEVMEQQTVTIAKAGIHVSLNARCSVLAAANPRYGEYEDKRSVENNISMPPSLLSRFDLIFIVRDRHDEDVDRKIAMRVTKNHRFEGVTSSMVTSNDSSGVVPPEILQRKADGVEEFEQFNRFLHEDKSVQYMKVEFLKKYILYAKTVNPELTDETNDLICRKWAKLRSLDDNYAKNSGNRIIAQTIRSLESLIRLSTAYAKLRLSLKVDTVDVIRAFQIFNKAYYNGTENIDKAFWTDVDIPEDLMTEFRNLKINRQDREEPRNGDRPNGEPNRHARHTRTHDNNAPTVRNEFVGQRNQANRASEASDAMVTEQPETEAPPVPTVVFAINKDPIKSFLREYNQRVTSVRNRGETREELFNALHRKFAAPLTKPEFDQMVDFLMREGLVAEENGKLFSFS